MKNMDYSMSNKKFSLASVIMTITLLAVNAIAEITAGVDYTYSTDQSTCTVAIKTANGLQNIGSISSNNCTKTFYELANDIDLGGDGTSSCTPNWDNTNAIFEGTLDGKNHTVSGVCVKEIDNPTVFLFNFSDSATVKNINFSNIFLSSEYQTLQNDYQISIFRANSINEGKIVFNNVNLDNVNVSGNFGANKGYASLLVSSTTLSYLYRHVTAKNISLDVQNTKQLFVGGFAAYVSRLSRIASGIDSSYIQGNITATTSDQLFLGSIIGKDTTFTDTLQNDTVYTNINANGGSNSYIGGFIGQTAPATEREAFYTYTAKKCIMNSVFKGQINANVKSSSYIGGLVGLIQARSFMNENNTIESPDGYTGVLFSGTGTNGYVGGIFGCSQQQNTIQNSTVKGIIDYPARTMAGIGAFIGDISNTYSSSDYPAIQQSYFIGSIPNNSSQRNYGFSGYGNFKVDHSYIINLSGVTLDKQSSAIYTSYAIGYSLTDSITVYTANKGAKKVLPKRPEFANALELIYDPLKNDGLPITVSSGEKPTYKILGVYVDDTLYHAYTNPNGQIAYKADGSPFTESDIPETWPAAWQTSWKINLSTVFRENQERIQKVDQDVDYTLSSCTTTIKTPRGLRYLSNIPNTCSSPTIILETDLDFGGDGTESCENNWDTTYALIKGTLQGNGHTISGICYKTTNQNKTALFNLGTTSDSVSILNVKFKDIYIKDSHTNRDAVYTSVFFPNTKTRILVQDVTFDNITVESELGSAKGYIGIVFGRNWATRHTIQNTAIKNSNIRVDRPAYVGSLIASTDSIFTVQNNSIDVHIAHNVTPSTNSYTYSYTGAVAGFLGNTYTMKNNHIYGKIELNSTTAYSTIYAAGLAANKSSYVSSDAVHHDTVEVDIQLNLTQCNTLYAGGLFGSSSRGIYSNMSYIGSIRGNVNCSHYIGGIIGRSSFTDTLHSVSATGKNGATDTIISITTTKTSTPYYSGGLIGNAEYAAPIKNATVRGIIKGAQIGAGFASVDGNFSSDCVTDIAGFSYIGKLLPSYNSSSALGYAKSGVKINLKDSYAIDLGGKTTNLWATPSQTFNVVYGTSTDALVYIQDANETRDSAYSKTPVFAYKLNMAYEADQYDRFAYAAAEPTHHILGISGKDTLYRGYTNSQGYLAYKEDGSPFTESDLPAPDAWPANWPEEDKVNLTTAYHEDFIRMNIFTDTDRTIDNEKCIVNY